MSELTECPICSERYNRTVKMPKILSCGHTFCKECLVKSLNYSQDLLCSICRQKQNIMQPEQLITNRTIYDLLYNTTNVENLNKSITSLNSLKKEEEISFKIVMIGQAYSGKTSLVRRYISKIFNDKYKVTVGLDYAIKDIETKEGNTIKLQIWDTAGSEIFQSLASSYYRNSAGAIVVFDVTDKNSFEAASFWIDLYRESTQTKQELIYLIGNKIDLGNRVISTKEAKEFAESYSITKYFETSAKTGHNVDNLFNDIAKNILEIYPELVCGKNNTKKEVFEIGQHCEKKPKEKKGCCS